MSSSTYDKDSCSGLQIIGSKSQFYTQCFKCSKPNLLILPASYAFLDKHIITIETLCSQVCDRAFVFLPMLGPKLPYHKKHSPEKIGWQSAKDQSWGELFRSSVLVSYSRTDLCDPRLFTTISHNYAKIQSSFE